MSVTSLINQGKISATETQSLGSNVVKPRDIHTPVYELFIRAGIGSQAMQITEEIKTFISEISYEDNATQFDKLIINFSNQIDNFGGGKVLSILDSKLFAEGHIIELKMGYGKSLVTIGAGIIVKKEPDFPKDSPPTLSIECFDLLYKASRKRPRSGVSYKNFRDSQIASIIGSRNGFDIKIKDSRSFENIRRTAGLFNRVQPKGVSDYEFLKKIAGINGFDLFSKFDPDRKKFVLFFQPGALAKQREVFTFTYNEGDLSYKNTLLSFNPTLDAYDQGTDFEIFLVTNKKVGGSSFNPFKKFGNEEQKQLAELKEARIGAKAFSKPPFNKDGIQVAFKAFGRSFKFPPHKRFKSESDARKSIQEFIKRQKEHFVTGSGSLVGNEVIQSRQVHNLEGISDTLSGKYYFTKVVHKMSKDGPYSTSFNCRNVIDDEVVQSPPAFEISETDRRFEKVKKEESGRSSTISSGVGEGF